MKHKNSSRWTTWSLALMLSVSLMLPSPARAEPLREFIMSCAYGVMAGTLVGAASLAFTDKPGDNLNNIARGASLGLYAGILLGLYVVYGVSSEEEQAVERQTGGSSSFRYQKPPPLWVEPVWGASAQLTGAQAKLNLATF